MSDDRELEGVRGRKGGLNNWIWLFKQIYSDVKEWYTERFK